MSLPIFFLYFIIGVFPAIIWLLFYLRQDVHPESNKKVLEIFLWGVIMVIPVLLLETAFKYIFPDASILNQSFVLRLLYYIVAIGLVEEFFKYFVVKVRVIDSSHFDEPIDAMLYLIIAGLGLATAENLLVVFNIDALGTAVMLSSIRLLTAVFLHTLAAAITGYFLALSFNQKKGGRKLFVVLGLLISSIFHGLYDITIAQLETSQELFSFLLPIVIISVMAIIVYFFFKKVKNLPRSCKIN
ncbi:MAG TPA: PrsW family intramembrane metalloprotease [Candidatus Pacearchaeota archaeon]|nr:PrsW family intramembrane metalloprotease [Candidatus Pacearchaeota archaeon]HOK94019.1 PrsW family intramembrane metalloprotease [Candidatus Pacearchaeota archaeon]HPO75090.1 PrsW family intramembrane metalloprotease [Candidatus Pacearchaeota archaeon]